ncbi:MAG: hydrogenase expression/formation protein HypE [Patescibacteria group bacterium]
MKSLNNNITLDHGSGGYASWELLKEIRGILKFKDKWQNTEDDGAVFDLGKEKLVFTTDAFIVDPIFFPGGDIGKIAICGTINDLAVMGAKPLGISLSIVIEEGFSRTDLMKIISSINKISVQLGVPIVTGDTKVLEKGKIDKIEITTSGVGLAKKIIQNNGAMAGDFIIVSGDLGEHTVAVLSKRFNYQTNIKSDSKSLNKELELVGKHLNACKDPTRGGLSANIVEIAKKSKVKIILDEKLLPYKKETIALSELLGIDFFSFASEGRFISSVSLKNVNKVLKILKEFNQEAKIIGRTEKGEGVFLKTKLGSFRQIEMPRGKLIPRIC